jgi:hypothetical protein
MEAGIACTVAALGFVAGVIAILVEESWWRRWLWVQPRFLQLSLSSSGMVACNGWLIRVRSPS